MTVREVRRITGVSVRTLHFYDEAGLLTPRRKEGSGYREYGEEDLQRLQMILLYRALEFPVKEIKRILDAPDFDRNRALEQQIELLQLRREHLEHLLTFARGIYLLGVRNMDFSAFDTRKIDDYMEQAKATWGKTAAWKEFEEKQKHRAEGEEETAKREMEEIFASFGAIRTEDPAGERARELVERLQGCITAHFYRCTPQILRGLGQMYAGGGAFTESIDAYGGPGTAAFVCQAIQRAFDGRQ